MFFSEVSFSSFVFRSFSLRLPSFSSSMINLFTLFNLSIYSNTPKSNCCSKYVQSCMSVLVSVYCNCWITNCSVIWVKACEKYLGTFFLQQGFIPRCPIPNYFSIPFSLFSIVVFCIRFWFHPVCIWITSFCNCPKALSMFVHISISIEFAVVIPASTYL